MFIAGELFLRQLENRADPPACPFETPIQVPLPHFKHRRTTQQDSASPLPLPSLRKLRFKTESTPLKRLDSNTKEKGHEHDEKERQRSIPGAEDSPGDDFIIHCSQNYERSCDQTSLGTPETTPETNSQRSRSDFAESQEPASLVDGTGPVVGEVLGSAKTSTLAAYTPKPNRSRPIELSFPSCAQKTPKSVMKTPTYSVFRNISERKTIHIVRHGESVYNAIDRYSRSLEDPFVFDAPLTDLGRQQALALKDKLIHLVQSKHSGLKSSDVLWVTSPLTRCIQTMLTAYNQYTKTLRLEDKLEELPMIKVCCHMAEHLATTGDIGRPRSLLVKDFPKIAESFEDLEEMWWWQPGKNCALNMKFDSREPKKNLQKRVGLFRQWLHSQPHKVIIAFGHSTFWKEFSGNGTRLKNCEVDTIHV